MFEARCVTLSWWDYVCALSLLQFGVRSRSDAYWLRCVIDNVLWISQMFWFYYIKTHRKANHDIVQVVSQRHSIIFLFIFSNGLSGLIYFIVQTHHFLQSGGSCEECTATANWQTALSGRSQSRKGADFFLSPSKPHWPVINLFRRGQEQMSGQPILLIRYINVVPPTVKGSTN